MNRHRSISYYARREKLRGILANATRRRKQNEDVHKAANENEPVAVDRASLQDRGAGRSE